MKGRLLLLSGRGTIETEDEVVVVIYEGGRIPGAAEEGAAAGEVIGEWEQNRWWQYNAPMWHCIATVEKSKRVRQHASSQ